MVETDGHVFVPYVDSGCFSCVTQIIFPKVVGFPSVWDPPDFFQLVGGGFCRERVVAVVAVCDFCERVTDKGEDLLMVYPSEKTGTNRVAGV